MSKLLDKLSRRQRQIMDIVYRLGSATVGEVQAELGESLSYSSVRAFMGILEEKELLKHKMVGRAFVYSPVVTHSRASRAALKQVVNTFYEGSVENVVAALINMKGGKVSSREFERLRAMIQAVPGKGSKK